LSFRSSKTVPSNEVSATSKWREVMAKVSISSQHVELCQLYGSMMRDVIRYPIHTTECWDFESQEVFHIPTGALEYVRFYGSGIVYVDAKPEGTTHYFKKDEPRSLVHLRSVSIPTPTTVGKEWRLSLWLKFPSGKVVDLHFVKGTNQDPEQLRIHNTLPPDEIKFR